MNEELNTIAFSARASLVALGLRFQQLNIWPVVKECVTIKQKVLQYTPLEKVLDCFINILAGGMGVVEVTRGCGRIEPGNGRLAGRAVPSNRRSATR